MGGSAYSPRWQTLRTSRRRQGRCQVVAAGVPPDCGEAVVVVAWGEGLLSEVGTGNDCPVGLICGRGLGGDWGLGAACEVGFTVDCGDASTLPADDLWNPTASEAIRLDA